MARPSVSTSTANGVSEIVLDREQKRNALTAAMIDSVREAVLVAGADSAVHVVLIRSEGPDFCAGFDLSALDPDELPEARYSRELRDLFEFSLSIRDLAKPTICLVQGANVAAGLLISQACDLVVAADTAYFHNPLPRMGGVGLEVLIEPFDIGFRRSKRHLFTGDRIPATLAAEYGMVTDLVPAAELLRFGRDLAARIATMPPLTLRYIKQSLNHAQDLGGMRSALEHHFSVHQLGHQTHESRVLLHENRRRLGLKSYFEQRDAGRD